MDVFYASAPNLCNVCIDKAEKGEYAGRLYHYYQLEPESFKSQYEMIRRIELLCDRVNYPQASEQIRSFAPTDTCLRNSKEPKVERCMSKEKLIEPKGEKVTFVVHVMYRQNATWQGSVTWAEKKQTANFRSALELIKLMDSAVEATAMADGTQEKDDPPPEASAPARQAKKK